MTKPVFRTALILLAALFAVAVPSAQNLNAFPVAWGFAGAGVTEYGHRPIVGMFAFGFAAVFLSSRSSHWRCGGDRSFAPFPL